MSTFVDRMYAHCPEAGWEYKDEGYHPYDCSCVACLVRDANLDLLAKHARRVRDVMDKALLPAITEGTHGNIFLNNLTYCGLVADLAKVATIEERDGVRAIKDVAGHRVILHDGGYRDTSGAFRTWIPDGRVIIQTDGRVRIVEADRLFDELGIAKPDA